MSKLMVIPNKKEDINIILNKDIEGIILGVKDLSIYELSLDIDDIIEIASTTDKKICIAINKMIHNSDLELVKEVLSKIKNSKVSGILFYDLGVFNLIKKLDIDKELILSQEHLNASTKSNLFYYNKGIKSSYITSDITFDEIRKIKENTKMNIYYTVYGYLPIFYSRRLLLTNYFKYIDKKIYKKYNDLVFVSQDNMEKFQNIYNDLNTENMHVIYNYIDKDLVIKKSNYNIKVEFDYNSINFLTVCRLVKQKAIDRFIRVHSKLINRGLKHKVYIIGDGPEKENLQKLIKQENVEDTFILLGKKENPYPYIKNANYFCLLSEFEGYGMVLEEAKILNKPIIITNTAARECIENYPKALILENSEDEIYDGLYKLLNDNDDKIFNNTQTSTEYDNTEKLQKIIELVGD